jgi:hypothetical protein
MRPVPVRSIKSEDDKPEVVVEVPQERFGLRIAAFGSFLVIVVGTCLALSLLLGDKPSIQGGATEQQVHRLYHARNGTGEAFLEQVTGETSDHKFVAIYNNFSPSALAIGLGSDSCLDDWYVTEGKWFILPHALLQPGCTFIPRKYEAKREMVRNARKFFAHHQSNGSSGSKNSTPKVISKDSTKFHTFPTNNEVATYAVAQWNSVSGPGEKQNIVATSMSCINETPISWIPNGKWYTCTATDRQGSSIGTVRVQYGDANGAVPPDDVKLQFHVS